MEHTLTSGAAGRATTWWTALLAVLMTAFLAPGATALQLTSDEGLSVQLTDPVLKLGDRTALVIEVQDREPSDVRLPEVEGIEFGRMQGPDYSRVIQYIGGRAVQEITYRYVVELTCEVEGRFEIPPVVADFGTDELVSSTLVLEVVRDARGDALGHLVVGVPFERVAVGQSVPIDIVFGCRASLLNNQNAVFDLTLPWLGALGREAVEVVPPDRRDGRPTTVTINGGRQTVEASGARSIDIDGETYRVVTLSLAATPLRTGEIDLSGTVLRISTGTWRQNMFGRREFQPRDEFFKHLGEQVLSVEPLPEVGRPIGFTGAVGAFEAKASLDVSQMFVGDSFKLVVEYTGAGNLADFGAPQLRFIEGFEEDFAVYGSSEVRDPDARRIVYDVAPLTDAVDEVPPVVLDVFDPVAWEYTALATEPLPIDVRSRPGAAAPTAPEIDEPRSIDFERDIVDIETGALRAAGVTGSAPRESTLVALLGAISVAWFALRLAARREVVSFGSAAERRRALRRLEKELSNAETPEQDLRAWAAFVAVRTGEPVESWVGRDVRRDVRVGHLALGEVTTDLIARQSEHLEAAAYGDDPRVAHDDVLRTARDLLEEGL